MHELIVDSFAGGGGASTGIEIALGRSPDIAINHDAVALAMHATNHPDTLHIPHNVWKVDPTDVCKGRPVGLLWASPDCKHFSKAKGGKPVSKNIRDLAWVVVRWAKQVRPRVIFLENVEEFADWGPVLENGLPCPERKGLHFRRFVRELQREGYKVQWKELRACDYGAPTVRKRLFMIARRDGLPIVWPAPTHGAPANPLVAAGKLKPWRTAAEIIDWSLPCHSIFLTTEEGKEVGVRRPLAPATMARIAKGVQRYVLDAAEPFIVPLTHTRDKERGQSTVVPLATITTAHRGEQALVAPTLIQTGYGERRGQSPRVPGLEKPLGTAVDGVKHALVSAFLAQHTAGSHPGRPAHHPEEPVSTISTKGCQQSVVSAGIVSMKGNDRRGSSIEAPAPTVCAGGWHQAEVRAFLVRYFGTDQDPSLREPLATSTTKERDALVMVHGEPYEIVDIGMRMLTPRELFNAQGFPQSYLIAQTADGTPITKTDQIRLCGNSVTPPLAAALVQANYAQEEVTEAGVPAFALTAAE